MTSKKTDENAITSARTTLLDTGIITLIQNSNQKGD